MYLYKKDKKEEFGSFLKSLREAYGYTKADIARILHINAPAINELEDFGTGVGTEGLIILAELYDMSFEDLLLGNSNVLDMKKSVRILESVCYNNEIDIKQINEENKRDIIKAYVDLEAFLLNAIEKKNIETGTEEEIFDQASNYYKFKIVEKKGEEPFNHKLIYSVISGFDDEIDNIYLEKTLDDDIIRICEDDYELLSYYFKNIPENRLNTLFTKYYSNGNCNTNALVAFTNSKAKLVVDGKVDINKTLDLYSDIINKLNYNGKEVRSI